MTCFETTEVPTESQEKINLNNLLLSSADWNDDVQIYDHNIRSGNTNVYFRHLKSKLIGHINEYSIMVGCVAWLTDFDILRALSSKESSIIVQKEDFLRPDLQSNRFNWKNTLRMAYKSLHFDYERYAFHDNVLSHMSICADPSIEPVRCVGNFNSGKKPAFPRMHNKFIVFCKYKPEDNDDVWGSIIPCAVWTGSFNFTKNAGYSFENALFINNPDIAMGYFKEYGFIAGLSEPLDWTSKWCEPEWRIGT